MALLGWEGAADAVNTKLMFGYFGTFDLQTPACSMCAVTATHYVESKHKLVVIRSQFSCM